MRWYVGIERFFVVVDKINIILIKKADSIKLSA